MLKKETGFPVDIMQKQYAEPVILYRALKDMQYAAAYIKRPVAPAAGFFKS
jgi:hypothetical protein